MSPRGKEDAAAPLGRVFHFLCGAAWRQSANLRPNGRDAVGAGEVLVGPDVGKATLARDCSHFRRLARAEFDEQPSARGE